MTRDEKNDLFCRLYGGTAETKPEEKPEVDSGKPLSRSARAFLDSLKNEEP